MTSSTPTHTPSVTVARTQQSPSPAASRADGTLLHGTKPELDLPDREGRAKVALDYSLGLILFVLCVPAILVAAVAVRLTSSGPAFYLQTRLGRGGRPFRIIKLRTMYHNCEKASGVRWSTPGDVRITRLGRFLRATHLDELPQLINVLRGEMSLVGPRPERPEITPILEGSIPNYRERLRVRPGVTGLAQLRLPADTCVPGVRRKLAYDLHYIRTYGLVLDLCLMACTLLKMMHLPVTAVLDVCRIPGPKAVGLADALTSSEGGKETRKHSPLPSQMDTQDSRDTKEIFPETRKHTPLPPKG